MKTSHLRWVVIALLLTVVILYLYPPSDPSSTPTDPIELAKIATNNVKLTREYQIDLDRDYFKRNRNQKVDEFLAWLRASSNGLFDISREDMLEEIYHRYSYGGYAKHLIIRVRDFVYGPRKGMTTLDFKIREGETMVSMLNLEGSIPAKPWYESAVLKVEQDIHACDTRWSRGSRIFLDHSPVLDTIADYAMYFPDVYKLGTFEPESPLKLQGFNVFTWQLSSLATLPNGLHYKLTFTFTFKTLEEAINPETSVMKKDGELSLRLYADNLGWSRTFNPEHLEFVNDLYEKMIWSDWNIDPDMGCLEEGLQEEEVWRQPIE